MKGGDLGVLLLILYFKVILNIYSFIVNRAARVKNIGQVAPRNLIT